MDLHTTTGGTVDAGAFERDTLARIGMPREVAMRHRLPQFTHLFASDAHRPHYSYLWSEVMDADTWKAFLEAGGPWDKAVAKRLRGASSRMAIRSIESKPIACSAVAIRM